MFGQTVLHLTCRKFRWPLSKVRLHRSSIVATLLLLMVASSVSAVPKRVANRMVPSWWFMEREICLKGSDCKLNECCTRPMLSVHAYCMPRRERGQVCDASPLVLNEEEEMYFNDCPCLREFACATINKDYHGSCVDLLELDVDFRRFVTNMKSGANFVYHRGIPAARKSQEPKPGQI